MPDATWDVTSLTELLTASGVARYLARWGPLFGAAAPLPQAGRPGEPTHPTTECLAWLGKLTEKGYGRVMVRDAAGRQVNSRVHLVTYELAVGPVPDGRSLGHWCERRACSRPDHVRPLTNQQNAREGARRRFPDWLLALAPVTACATCCGTMTPSIDARESEGKAPRWCFTCTNCAAAGIKKAGMAARAQTATARFLAL